MGFPNGIDRLLALLDETNHGTYNNVTAVHSTLYLATSLSHSAFNR